MNAEITKPAHCATCGHAVSPLETVSALTMLTARATTEMASLHATLIQQAALLVSNAPTAASALPAMDLATIDRSAAGSIEAYQEIMKKNGHGRLGRTHMEDVDLLVETARAELDSYLRRTIHLIAPVGGANTTIDADKVFATLSTFGLRLEDRSPMADGTVFDDSKNHDTATIRRLQNFGRHYYTARTGKYECYWNGFAIETLVELARYRGLFGADGFLTAAK
ncbi:hypothetical protein Q9L58_001925 [Maublancomyces gigas]|uniref:Uncharacterized protein n=1 Tax=Discina gigas TaxID=1032678 RepID=A0ABR3GSZ3_9PEZI